MRVIGAEEGCALRSAGETLRGGGGVAFPTETFYGLGVKFDIESALERLFALKGRPVEKAVSLIIGNADDLPVLANEDAVTPRARRLIERYWPGPLTLIFDAREGVSHYLTTRGTVAVRVPGESFALRLTREAGFPVTATSANPAGMAPPVDAGTVGEYFGRGVDLLVDGGRTGGGRPSTIADVTGGEIKVIRHGAVRLDEALKGHG
jgi:L-threonylcarbamoyladenylate synthase